MPLVKGKSQASFDKNVKTEIHSGKPKAQALAIAYSVKRRNQGKKMAYGGMVEGNPKLAAAHMSMQRDPKSLVAKVIGSKKGYAMGGEVMDDDSDDAMPDYSRLDDFLSDEQDDVVPRETYPDPDEKEEDFPFEDKKRKILSKIMMNR